MRPGRPSLALDWMEEMGPFLGDRFVFSLLTSKAVGSAVFVVKVNGAGW